MHTLVHCSLCMNALYVCIVRKLLHCCSVLLLERLFFVVVLHYIKSISMESGECATPIWGVNTALEKDDVRSRSRLVVNIIK